MSLELSNNELETLGKKFQEWRRKNPQSRYPKNLWNKALELTEIHGFNAVAQLTGYPPSYLRRKIKRRSTAASNETQFIEIKAEASLPPKEINLRIQRNGLIAELSFQGDIEQVFPLLSSIVQERS